jgi:uncharacterized membrane protein YjjP (DUF1212 family)
MASSTDILVYPVAAIVLGGFASVITLLLHKYLAQNFFIKSFPDATIRFFSSVLGGIFAAIIVATRSPSLTSNSSVAGL